MSYQHDQADVVVEDKERVLTELQKKVASLERRLQGNLSQDEHLQELLQEVNHSSTIRLEEYLKMSTGYRTHMFTQRPFFNLKNDLFDLKLHLKFSLCVYFF